MANDFIQIQRDQSAATEAAELLALKNVLRQAYEIAIRVRGKMQHKFISGDPSTINWASLETLWGIPVLGGNSVGPTANGKIIFTFIDGIVNAAEGTGQNSSIKDFTETVG